MPTPERLTIYGPDGVTPLSYGGANVVITTQPGSDVPDLKWAPRRPSVSVDLLNGKATIGEMVAEILDKRTNPADQSTGWFTGLLGQTGGVGDYRAVYEEQVGGAWLTVLDGVAGRVQLMESDVTFSMNIRDPRERVRRLELFTRSGTTTIFPRGVLDGFGRYGGTGDFALPPTTPVTGVYEQDDANGGQISFVGSWSIFGRIPRDLVVDELQQEYLRGRTYWRTGLDDTLFGYAAGHVEILWRLPGAGTWNVVTEPFVQRHGGGGLVFSQVDPQSLGVYREARDPQGNDVVGMRALHLRTLNASDPLPTDGQTVEVIALYVGPPTEEAPLHLEGTTGEILQALLDGEYSPRRWNGTAWEIVDPGIPHDPTAVAALTDPMLGIVTAPVAKDEADGQRAALGWVEKMLLKPIGAAPGLNASFELAPIRYELPTSATSLPTLNDSNCRNARWLQDPEEVRNAVSFKYSRFLVDGTLGIPGKAVRRDRDRGGLDRLAVVPVPVKFEHEGIASSPHGEQVHDVDGAMYSAVVPPADEDQRINVDIGFQAGRRLFDFVTNRYLRGGKPIVAEAARSSSKDWPTGSYIIVGVSWLPDLATGLRGMNRVAQIVGRTPIDNAWETLDLVDAGDSVTHVTLPAVGTLTVDSDGIVSIPVTFAGTSEGGVPVTFAVVEYAINDTEPGATSELWQRLGRSNGNKTFRTQPIRGGEIVWVRARGEGVNRISSAWTNSKSIAIPVLPFVQSVRLTVHEDRSVEVSWTPPADAAALRLHYARPHGSSSEPNFPVGEYVDVDASLGTYTFDPWRVIRGDGDLNPDGGAYFADTLEFSIKVEPFETWDGSNAGGSAGDIIYRAAIVPHDPDVWVEFTTEWVPDVQALKAGHWLDCHIKVGENVESLEIEGSWLSAPGGGGSPTGVSFLYHVNVGGDTTHRVKDSDLDTPPDPIGSWVREIDPVSDRFFTQDGTVQLSSFSLFIRPYNGADGGMGTGAPGPEVGIKPSNPVQTGSVGARIKSWDTTTYPLPLMARDLNLAASLDVAEGADGNAELKHRGPLTASGISGGYTPDYTKSDKFNLTLGGATTLNSPQAAMAEGEPVLIRINLNGQSLSLGTGWEFPAGFPGSPSGIIAISGIKFGSVVTAGVLHS